MKHRSRPSFMWLALCASAPLALAACIGDIASGDPDETPQGLAPATYTFATGTAPGKCIDVSGAGTHDGANVQQWTCNGTGAQSFRIETVSGELVRLVNTHSNKCVDVAGGGSADGTNVRQWTCNGNGAQTFRIDDAGAGQVRIVNPQSGK